MAVRYALFLGCIIPNRYPSIELATRNVAQALGMELVDMKGASCCPAPGVFKSFDKFTWLTIAARNLCIAEGLGCDIVTLCNGCYSSLKEANIILKEDATLQDKVNGILRDFNKKFYGKVEVRHFIEVVQREVGIDNLRRFVKRPLRLNVAVHYGCHLLKPKRHREVKSVERPTFLDELVEALGAKSISYRDKMMCCGAGGGVRASNPDVALDMTKEKLKNIKDAGADCVISPCAFCHLQFDRGQVEAGLQLNVPILHYVQSLGLALGLEPEKLGLYSHAISVEPILKKLAY